MATDEALADFARFAATALVLAEKYAKEGTEKEAEEKEESDIEDYLQPTKKSRRGR